jgi:hypothetical protein
MDGRRELRRCFKAEIAVTCHENSKRGEFKAFRMASWKKSTSHGRRKMAIGRGFDFLLHSSRLRLDAYDTRLVGTTHHNSNLPVFRNSRAFVDGTEDSGKYRVRIV